MLGSYVGLYQSTFFLGKASERPDMENLLLCLLVVRVSIPYMILSDK